MAAGICAVAVVSTIRHRAGSGVLTLVLTAALTVLVLATAVVALPHAEPANLTPFAPAGVVGRRRPRSVLTWVLTGWEAVTNFTGVLRDPRRTLPRVTAATLVVVALLYAAVAVPQILVLGPDGRRDQGAGRGDAAGRRRSRPEPSSRRSSRSSSPPATPSPGSGSLAELGTRTQPAPQGSAARTARASALAIPVLIMIASLVAVAVTPLGTAQLVSICAGSQVPVYLLGLAAGVKLLPRLEPGLVARRRRHRSPSRCCSSPPGPTCWPRPPSQSVSPSSSSSGDASQPRASAGERISNVNTQPSRESRPPSGARDDGAAKIRAEGLAAVPRQIRAEGVASAGRPRMAQGGRRERNALVRTVTRGTRRSWVRGHPSSARAAPSRERGRGTPGWHRVRVPTTPWEHDARASTTAGRGSPALAAARRVGLDTAPLGVKHARAMAYDGGRADLSGAPASPDGTGRARPSSDEGRARPRAGATTDHAPACALTSTELAVRPR